MEITAASDNTKSARPVLAVKQEKKNLTYNFHLTCIIAERSARPALPHAAATVHTCTHKHAHAYPETSSVPAHLNPFPSQRGEEARVTSAPVPAEASSVCPLLPNLPDVCWHPFLPSLAPLLTYSPFPAPSLFFSLLFHSLFPPALLSDLSFFPLSGVCTMHINYSEAVYWSLRLIQSEPGSALMGSRCTCYRLQRTLEEAERDRRSGGDS